MSIEVDVEDQAGAAVITVRGEVDMSTAPELQGTLSRLLDEGRTNIVVDLEGVEFLDSTGLGVMVGAHKRLLRSGERLALVCTQRSIRRVLDITGLAGVFSVHDSLDTAVGT